METQKDDPKLHKIWSQINVETLDGFEYSCEWIPTIRQSTWVREKFDKKILSEANSLFYFIHSGGTKIYQDLKRHFCWHGIKQVITSIKVFSKSTRLSFKR